LIPTASGTEAQLSRRGFLQGTAAAIVVPTLIPATAIGNDAPSNKLNVAIIGTGNNGCNWMPRFMKDARTKVVAVCDVNREGPGYWSGSVRGREYARRMVDKFYGAKTCKVYSDFREVLALKDIDAVYISTPDHWHAIIAIAAAEAGKDIYCQKPLALTVRQGRSIVDAVKKANVVFQTGSQQRSDFHFRHVCELVRNGRIGKLHTVRCGLPGGAPDVGKTAHLTETVPVPDGFDYEMWLGPAPQAPYCPARVGVNFRWILDYSGGQMTDWGGHHPDIAQWGMGTDLTGPVAIKNAKGRFAEHPVYNTATEYYFECHYENGVRLVISDKERGGVTFEGSDGKVWANRGSYEAAPKELLQGKIGPNEIHLYKSGEDGGGVAVNHVKNFIDCMFSRKETICPAEVGHRSITLAHLGNIALKTGRDLKWDPVKEEIVGDAGANEMLGRPQRTDWKS